MTTRITRKIGINAPKEQVWAALADFGGVQNYAPGVKASRATSPQPGGLGATRHCELLPMGTLEERIIEWQEGHSYLVEIYDGQKMPPVKNQKGRFSVETEGGQTAVTFSFEYDTSWGPVGLLMNRLMVKSMFEKGFNGMMLGLKHYVETGEAVDQAVFKRIRRPETGPSSFNQPADAAG